MVGLTWALLCGTQVNLHGHGATYTSDCLRLASIGQGLSCMENAGLICTRVIVHLVWPFWFHWSGVSRGRGWAYILAWLNGPSLGTRPGKTKALRLTPLSCALGEDKPGFLQPQEYSVQECTRGPNGSTGLARV